MKTYRTKATGLSDCIYKISGDRVLLVMDGGALLDVTALMLAGTDFTDPEQALIDLYTDEDGTEGVSIQEVTE